PWWKHTPVFRLSSTEERGVISLNTSAFETNFDRVTDLILVHSPVRYERYHAIVEQHPSLCRVYALAFGGEPALDREFMKRVYVCLRACSEASVNEWAGLLAEKFGIGLEAARLAIRVFEELEFITAGSLPATVKVAPSPAKRDLSESPAFTAAQQADAAKQEWLHMTPE